MEFLRLLRSCSCINPSALKIGPEPHDNKIVEEQRVVEEPVQEAQTPVEGLSEARSEENQKEENKENEMIAVERPQEELPKTQINGVALKIENEEQA